jgi:hypothetical protein
MPDETGEALERLDEALEAEGRTRADFTVTICPYFKPIDRDDLERYEELGVDRVNVVAFAFDRDGLLQTLDSLATTLL